VSDNQSQIFANDTQADLFARWYKLGGTISINGDPEFTSSIERAIEQRRQNRNGNDTELAGER